MRMPRGVFGVPVAVGLWWMVVRVFDIRAFFLPGPADVAGAFVRQWPYLLQQAAVTLGHTLTGFGIAAAAGVATAMGLAASRRVRAEVEPLLVAVQATPKVAFAPLLIVWLGFGPASKVTLVVLLCFFPVVVATLAGLTSTPAELVELARSLSASRWQTYTRIRLWWALPQVFTGLKLGLTFALIGAVVAQISTPNTGLGAVIVRAGQSADTPLAFAAIVLLSATGISLYYTLAAVERAALPWRRATTA